MENPQQLSLDEVKQLVTDQAAAAQQIEPLLQTLQTDEEELCAWTTDALQGIEQVSDEFADLLSSYCMHEQAKCAVWACKLIMKIQSPASLQAALCRALTEHSSLGVRQQAAAALASVASPSSDTLSALEAAAASEDPRLSRLAAQALEKNKAA